MLRPKGVQLYKVAKRVGMDLVGLNNRKIKVRIPTAITL